MPPQNVVDLPVQPATGLEQDRTARFALAPVLGLGAVDGVWWPRSIDAESELGPLLAALAPQVGRPFRVSLGVSAWQPGAWQIWVDGYRVRLERFADMDPATVEITHLELTVDASSYHDPVLLLVIPPETDPAAARLLMARVASGTASGSPASLLPT